MSDKIIEIELTDLRVVDGYRLREDLRKQLRAKLTVLKNLSDEVFTFRMSGGSDVLQFRENYLKFSVNQGSFDSYCFNLLGLGLISVDCYRKLDDYITLLERKISDFYYSNI